jgi:hypothetical protein
MRERSIARRPRTSPGGFHLRSGLQARRQANSPGHLKGPCRFDSKHLNGRPRFCLSRRFCHIFLDGFLDRPRKRRLGRRCTPYTDEPTSLALNLAPRPVHRGLRAPRCILTANRRIRGAAGCHCPQCDRSRYDLDGRHPCSPLAWAVNFRIPQET